MKAGREMMDPLGRKVTAVRDGYDASGPYLEVRLAGPYGATVRYPVSALEPWVEPVPVFTHYACCGGAYTAGHASNCWNGP